MVQRLQGMTIAGVLVAGGALLGFSVLGSTAAARASQDEEHGEEQDEVEEDIAFADAPALVRAAFAERSGGAQATAVERITEESYVEYEVEYAHPKGRASLTFSALGELLEHEVPVAPAELPAAVVKAIGEEYPGAELASADAVELHFFEVQVEVDGKTFEVRAFATGDVEEEHVGRDEAGDEHRDGDHEDGEEDDD